MRRSGRFRKDSAGLSVTAPPTCSGIEPIEATKAVILTQIVKRLLSGSPATTSDTKDMRAPLSAVPGMESKEDRVDDAWDILETANSRFPKVLAVTVASQVSETAFTYSSLHSSSSQLANFLRASGVRRAGRVAVCLPNSRECLEIHFACAALHAVLVNLNTSLVARELAHILSVSSPRCIIAHTRYQRALCEAVLQLTHSISQVIDQSKDLMTDSCPGRSF